MLVIIYISAICFANITIAVFGPWFSPVNALLLVSLDLVLRDRLHDKWRHGYLWTKMALLIVSAGFISYLLNPASTQIAVASTIAFTAAGFTNALFYHLFRNKPWIQRSNYSNINAAAVDSIIFPLLAFGVFMPGVTIAQFMMKSSGALVWSLILKSPQKSAEVKP